MSEALESLLGPFGETATEVVRLLDDEALCESDRKKKVAEAFDARKPGDASGMERLMVKDMERAYDNAHRD